MSKDRFADLLNGDLDGSLTEGEREALERLAAKDEGLRSLRAELRGVSRLCSEMSQVEPPPGLRPAVRRAIEGKSPLATHTLHRASKTDRFGEILSRFRFLKPEIRLAYAVLGGIALAGVALLLLMNTLQKGTLNQDEALGTMMLHDRTGSAWNTIPFAAPEVQGRIATQRTTTLDGVLIDLHYLGTGKGQLQISLGSREIRMMSRPEDPLTSVQVGPAEVTLAGSHLGELRLILNRPKSEAVPVQIVLSDGDMSVLKLNLFEETATTSDP